MCDHHFSRSTQRFWTAWNTDMPLSSGNIVSSLTAMRIDSRLRTDILLIRCILLIHSNPYLSLCFATGCWDTNRNRPSRTARTTRQHGSIYKQKISRAWRCWSWESLCWSRSSCSTYSWFRLHENSFESCLRCKGTTHILVNSSELFVVNRQLLTLSHWLSPCLILLTQINYR